MYQIFNTQLKNGAYTRGSEILNVASINWQDNINDVFISFDFQTTEIINPGSFIEIYSKDDNKTVLIGIITTTSRNNKFTYTYSGYDIGFYLEKNSVIAQFKNAKISDAIKQIISKVQLPIGEYPAINQTVTNIYKNKKASEILIDLLKIAKEKGLKDEYYYDCANGFVNLHSYTKNLNLKAYVADIYTVKSVNTINSFDIKESMEEMKTKVKVISSVTKNKQTSITEHYTTPDNDNLNKFGLLLHIEEVDGDKNLNYKQIGDKLLSELNKTTKTISLNLLGDYQMRKGVVIPLNTELLNLNNNYLIKSSSHSTSGTKETVQTEIELYEETI